ncbi:MAG: hypothetical protein LUH02_05235, partial [Erysipelotrichaceae bacterium]|nr:hypothetical protein [Erysipelotrichaceae bacterium]
QNVNYKGRIHDYNYIPLFIYDGTMCLLSAAAYFGYIKKPKEMDIAVPQGSNFRSNYKHPPFRFHYLTKEKYKIGTIEIKDDINSFKIYNKERTICDIIHDRKNIDKKMIKAVLKAYLKDPECDLEKLYKMAEIIHCQETLEIYLDMLL